MIHYWPWWAGAIALALVTINYTLITDRSLGISSAWDRVLHWRSERDLERMDAEFIEGPALAEAFAAATAAEFGAQPQGSVLPGSGQVATPTDSGIAGSVTGRMAQVTDLRPPAVVAQAVLLVSVFLGGLAASMSMGGLKLRYDMGDGFRALVTSNPTMMIVVLFGGGVLVGFGTRLAGGCSSGHGLSGCGRLRPVSLLATAVFFGTAVLVSFLLQWKVI